MRILRILTCTALLGLVSLGLATQAALSGTPPPAAQGAEATADVTPPVMALWAEKDIHFVYQAFTAYYSCDGLQAKVTQILKEIGARPGFKVAKRACFNPMHGAEWAPMLDIVVAMPQPATPELLAELAKKASQQELAARAGGKAAPAPEAAAEFPARVRRIDFRDSPMGLLQPGDCELVEQLRDQVFKPLGAKVVEDRMACVPHTLNNGIIVLSIEVLEPLPQK